MVPAKQELLLQLLWLLPSARTPQFVHVTTISLTHSPDALEWRIGGLTRSKFCSSIICFKRGIPKHKTLTLLNRCPTRDRLISWGLTTDPHCLLCNQGLESRDHLYFECPFSVAIWSPLATKLRLNLPSTHWE